MEQTNRTTNQNAGGFSFIDILVAFRKNWILILVIVILFSSMGVLYGKFEKPVYTASHQAFYSTHNIMVDDPNAAEHINAARAFMDTVADFADEEYVVKRADYLYGLYLKEKKSNPSLTAKQFLKDIDTTIYKQYTFTELSELVKSSVDVFFTREVLEDRKLVDRMFVLRGELTSRTDNKITVTSPAGTVVDIDRTDFLYAVKTDSYMSEYSFNLLNLLKEGDAVKVYTQTNSGLNIPTELVGKFVEATDSDLTITVNDVQVKINKENFKKVTRVLPSYFSANSIGVVFENGDNNTDESFVFTFKYTDDTPELAKEKVQFIIKAMAIEANIYYYNENGIALAKFVLFKNVDVTIDGSAGYLFYTSSVSKIKTFILFFVIGAVVGCFIAYLKELLDKTVKRKDDLEKLTNTKVLTIIPAEEGK